MSKRPIDRKRESAGMIEITDPDDPSGITGMIVIGKSLHALKENSIYEIKMGDDIDPKRSNPDIPNTYQRVLGYGSASPLVQRILLTAHVLFNKSYLPKGFDSEEALKQAFAALKDVTAMHDIAWQLKSDQTEAMKGARKAKHGMPVPAVGNIAARFESFIQKADHAQQSLLSIMRLFYGNKTAKNFETLTERVCHQHGADDAFCQFLKASWPFLNAVRATRNCVEHETPAQRVAARDFELNHAGKVELPSIEIIHPKSGSPRSGLLDYMVELTDSVSSIFELMIAHACHRHVEEVAGIKFGVFELPNDKRGGHRARFCYGFFDGKQVIHAS